MPLEPPDPLRVLSALRDQSTPLRQLVESFPSEPAYQVALDSTIAAITALEGAQKTQPG